jgi:hypothetical protein
MAERASRVLISRRQAANRDSVLVIPPDICLAACSLDKALPSWLSVAGCRFLGLDFLHHHVLRPHTPSSAKAAKVFEFTFHALRFTVRAIVGCRSSVVGRPLTTDNRQPATGN